MKEVLIILCVWLFFSCDSPQEYIKYHENKEIALIGQLISGKRNGEWISYDSSGRKLATYFYQDDTLRLRRQYINELLFAEEEMNGEHVKHGVTTTYYKNGTVESETSYVENRQVGSQMFYNPNGKISSKYIERNNESIKFYQYHENGELFVYADNLQNGVVNIHDTLGNKVYELLYKNGELIDTLKSY
ncbi:MAG: hypothetical protein WA958_08010 [Tunicatimonas sp.]